MKKTYQTQRSTVVWFENKFPPKETQKKLTTDDLLGRPGESKKNCLRVKGIVPVAIAAPVSFRLDGEHRSWYDRSGGRSAVRQ